MASTPQNALTVAVPLTTEEALDFDALFRQRLVEAGAVDQTRGPEQHERESLARELLVAAVAAELGE
jgi:hypothetical protein